MSDERRMSAYYFRFDPTGDDAVDRILSAVAWAGKAFHHTEEWNETAYAGQPPEDLAGQTPVLWIQNAATQASAKNAQLRARLAQAEEALKALVDTSFEAYSEAKKPEVDWDEYDHLVIPLWRAARATLAAIREGRSDE